MNLFALGLVCWAKLTVSHLVSEIVSSPEFCLSSNQAEIGLRVVLSPNRFAGLDARRGFMNSQLSGDMSVGSV